MLVVGSDDLGLGPRDLGGGASPVARLMSRLDEVVGSKVSLDGYPGLPAVRLWGLVSDGYVAGMNAILSPIPRRQGFQSHTFRSIEGGSGPNFFTNMGLTSIHALGTGCFWASHGPKLEKLLGEPEEEQSPDNRGQLDTIAKYFGNRPPPMLLRFLFLGCRISSPIRPLSLTSLRKVNLASAFFLSSTPWPKYACNEDSPSEPLPTDSCRALLVFRRWWHLGKSLGRSPLAFVAKKKFRCGIGWLA